jgi:hypothetical protein
VLNKNTNEKTSCDFSFIFRFKPVKPIFCTQKNGKPIFKKSGFLKTLFITHLLAFQNKWAHVLRKKNRSRILIYSSKFESFEVWIIHTQNRSQTFNKYFKMWHVCIMWILFLNLLHDFMNEKFWFFFFFFSK